MHGLPFELSDILIFLAAAGLVAPALHRLRVSPVLAFLLIGLVVGPNGLGRLAAETPWLSYVTIDNVEPARALAEIGVVLLLFLIGLEVSGPRLWAMRRLVFGLGAAQIAVCGAVIAGVAALWGNGAVAAVVIGLAFALSSTAIVLQLLSERGRLGTPTGRASLAVLLMQDLAVVPILLFVSLMGADDGGSPAMAVLRAGGVALAVIALIIVAGRIGARPFLQAVAVTKSPELFTAAVLLLIVATAGLTAASGLSVALGAFLAGLLLAETEFRHDVEVTLAPFKGLFLGLFFMSVGMTVDLGLAVSTPFLFVISVVSLVVIKAVAVIALARAFGVSWPAATETGFLLATGGEFAFIIIEQATSPTSGVIPHDTAQFMVLVAGASMILTPLLAPAGRRVAAALEKREAMVSASGDVDPDMQGHVIVVGYGRIGRLLGEVLGMQGRAHVALDADVNIVLRERRKGAAVYFGDARRLAMLRALGAERADAIVVTTDHAEAAEAIVSAAHREWPDVPVYARARDAAHGARLAQVGAAQVTLEALETSLELTGAVLQGLGVSNEVRHSVIDARRKAELDVIMREGEAGKASDA